MPQLVSVGYAFSQHKHYHHDNTSFTIKQTQGDVTQMSCIHIYAIRKSEIKQKASSILTKLLDIQNYMNCSYSALYQSFFKQLFVKQLYNNLIIPAVLSYNTWGVYFSILGLPSSLVATTQPWKTLKGLKSNTK